MKKTFTPQWIALLVLMLCIILLDVNAQWSEANILFEDFARPACHPDDVSSPLINVERDSNGTLHLIWSNKTVEGTRLAYASKSNGYWSDVINFPFVDYKGSVWPSTAISNDGTIHCTWTTVDDQDHLHVMYAYKTPYDAWSNPLLISDNTYIYSAFSQLYIDEQNLPHVIYDSFIVDGFYVFCGLKHVVINNSEGSVTELVAPVSPLNAALNPRVEVDENGIVHCLWYDAAPADSMYGLFSSTYNGISWSENIMVASYMDFYLMDESPIVLMDTPGEGICAAWLSLDPATGQYSHYDPVSGWNGVNAINSPSFHMGAGESDYKGNLHLTGSKNDKINQIFDFEYHCFNGDSWTHEIIEPTDPLGYYGWADMIITGDTLWCYYVSYYPGEEKLIERYKILDYLTPVKEIPLNKEIKLTVVPNPVIETSEVTFNLNGPGEVTFILTNSLGQSMSFSIRIQAAGEHKMNINKLFHDKLFKGINILQIITKEGIDTFKVLNHN